MDRIEKVLNPGRVLFDRRLYLPKDIFDGIDRVAGYLSEKMVSASPFVYLFATNNIKTLFSLYGISKAGRRCVIVDRRVGRIELSEMMHDTPPSACIRIDANSSEWNFDREIEFFGGAPFTGAREELEEVCMLMYTAAHDGFAKAAMLTHSNILSDAFAIASGNGVGPGTVSMAALPLSHGFGLQTGLITPLCSGGDLVIVNDNDMTGIQTISRLIEECRVTHCYSIPALYYLLAKSAKKGARLDSLTSSISGGYRLTPLVYDVMMKYGGLPIRQGYGLTEASPVCSWVYTDDRQYDPMSIGRPIDCCEMKIRSDSNSATGEILVKGRNVMKGYYNKPQVNETVLQGGWLHTGDLGYRDAKGYYYVTATRKRMINHYGMKVYPAEMERHLQKHTNVRGSIFYGSEDPVGGERVGCTIALKRDTSDERILLKQWMEQQLTEYKKPKVIQFVDEAGLDETRANRNSVAGLSGA